MPEESGRTYRHHHSHWGAFTAEVEAGRLIGVLPFAKDPHPSPILRSMRDGLYAENRVLRPVVRKGWLEKGPESREGRGCEPFVAVSWEKALDLAAVELERVRANFGNEAIFGGSYGWSSAGRFHHAKSLVHRFLNTIGGFTGQVHTYSIAAGYSILPYTIGNYAILRDQCTTWDSIAENTELLVMFGGNPLKNMQVGSGGQGMHTAEDWLRRAKERGCRFVNIGPIRQDAADFLDPEWIPLRPGTDTALMLGLAHTLREENLHDADFLARCCEGYEKFECYLSGETDGTPKSAEWAAAICEVDAATIRSLARRMAGARTMLSTNWSLQRGDHGEQPFWMTVTLAAMLGQIGLPGGGFGFGYGSMAGMGEPRQSIPAPTLKLGVNRVKDHIPVARISDMLLHPGGPYTFEGEDKTYPDIRLIYWCGGNPFHHHQDINRLIRAWRRPDTIIVHEPWWTSTARFSDIVLPATTTMERNDIGASSRDRFILAMEKIAEPQGESRNDYDIFSGLSERMGTREAFTEGRDETEWLRHIYEDARERAAERLVDYPSFDEFWEKGHVEIPAPERPHVLFEDFRQDPKGRPLGTPSGKIEIHSKTIEGYGYADCPPHPAWLEPCEWLGGVEAADYPLHLISNQPTYRLHSQIDTGRNSRENKIKEREAMWMHPDDVRKRNLADGDVARVFNSRGEILAGVRVTDAVRPGVIQIPTGAWYDPLVPGEIGTLDVHGNPNVLTPDKGTSSLGQGPSAHSTLVEAEKYEGELPEIQVFRPPVIEG